MDNNKDKKFLMSYAFKTRLHIMHQQELLLKQTYFLWSIRAIRPVPNGTGGREEVPGGDGGVAKSKSLFAGIKPSSASEFISVYQSTAQ